MTKKDFELIAAVLARAEATIAQVKDDNEVIEPEQLHEIIVADFARALSVDHPRFSAKMFVAACTPLKQQALKERILAKLRS